MTTPRRDISSVQIRRLHSSANIKHAGVESTVNIFPIMCFKKIAKSPFSINIDWRCHGECDGPRDVWLLQAEFLALKHASRILEHSSNPARGFSMMEQIRLCAVWPMKNWLGSSLNQIQGWTTVRESYSPALVSCHLSILLKCLARHGIESFWNRINLRISSKKCVLVANRPFGIRYGRRRSLIKFWQLNFRLSRVALFERVVHLIRFFAPVPPSCNIPSFALMKTLMLYIFNILFLHSRAPNQR